MIPRRYFVFFAIYSVLVWLATTGALLRVEGGTLFWQIKNDPSRLFGLNKYLLYAVCIVCWSASWGALLATFHLSRRVRRGRSVLTAAALGTAALALLGIVLRGLFRRYPAEPAYVVVYTLATALLVGFMILAWVIRLRRNLCEFALEASTPSARFAQRPNTLKRLDGAKWWRVKLTPRLMVLLGIGLLSTVTTVLHEFSISRNEVAPTPGVSYRYEFFPTGGFPFPFYVFGTPPDGSFNGLGPEGRFLLGNFLIDWALTTIALAIPTAMFRAGLRTLRA